LDVRFFYL